jgi:pimeloyl-ACP methyl ester carboxylesterase
VSRSSRRAGGAATVGRSHTRSTRIPYRKFAGWSWARPQQLRASLSTDAPDSPECATVPPVPEIHYTRSADGTNLAYQVSGAGPLEMLLMLTGIPIDLSAEEPGIVRLRKRLTKFSRTVWFDIRGRGASEGEPRDAIIEEVFAADLNAVLDAAGFERPVLVMAGEGGEPAVHFSVNHAERVTALVLVNSCAYYVREDDYPWGTPPESLDYLQASITAHWGRSAPRGAPRPQPGR